MIPENVRIFRKPQDNIERLREACPGGLHFVVGDTHCAAQTLCDLLEKIAFDPQKDHVYFVGDYNSGGDPTTLLRVLAMFYEPDLSLPGFHLIRGNHERELGPSYPLPNLPDMFVLRGRQLTYYITHSGMVTDAFDAVNADMAESPEQRHFAYRFDEACVRREGGPLREVIWSRGGLFHQNSGGRRWPTEQNLYAHGALILHGHAPYSYFCEKNGYGEENVFFEEAHVWFSEALFSFNLDSDVKGRNKNGETYRGLTALCLEVCEEIAAQCEGRLTREGVLAAQNPVFSVPYRWQSEALPGGDLNRILEAAPEQKTIWLGQDRCIYIY